MTDRVAVALVVAALCLPGTGLAQVVYKLIGRDGRVTYSDRAPKDFDGKVMAIDVGAGDNVLPAAKPTGPGAEGNRETGVGERRRQLRAELEKRLLAAQARYDAARKAKADGEAPGDDESQVVQRRYPALKPGEMPPRPNCFQSTDPGSGSVGLNCPSQVPSEKYYERQRKLDEELARAAEELRAAEQAYRRGTD